MLAALTFRYFVQLRKGRTLSLGLLRHLRPGIGLGQIEMDLRTRRTQSACSLKFTQRSYIIARLKRCSSKQVVALGRVPREQQSASRPSHRVSEIVLTQRDRSQSNI